VNSFALVALMAAISTSISAILTLLSGATQSDGFSIGLGTSVGKWNSSV
jgi:hypothetical protein